MMVTRQGYLDDYAVQCQEGRGLYQYCLEWKERLPQLESGALGEADCA